MARTEPNYYILGVDTQVHDLTISAKARLADVMKMAENWRGGATDLSLPAIWLTHEKLTVDAIVTYTDGETWAGQQHPFQAVQEYRQRFAPECRVVNAAMTATSGQLSDPFDPLALECAGIDPSLPQAIRAFVAGA